MSDKKRLSGEDLSAMAYASAEYDEACEGELARAAERDSLAARLRVAEEALRKARVFVDRGYIECTCEVDGGADCVYREKHADIRENTLAAVDAALRPVPPAPVPAYCPVHQHYKWCDHNGGVLGPTGYEAPAPLCPTCQVVHDPGECRIEGG